MRNCEGVASPEVHEPLLSPAAFGLDNGPQTYHPCEPRVRHTLSLLIFADDICCLSAIPFRPVLGLLIGYRGIVSAAAFKQPHVINDIAWRTVRSPSCGWTRMFALEVVLCRGAALNLVAGVALDAGCT